jgi:hypothetical protein
MALLRGTAVLYAVALVAQAVTAGMLLSSADGRRAHQASATLVGVAALLQLVAAVLVWRVGRGPFRFVSQGIETVVLVVVQVVLGMTGIKIAHVPVGVLMFGGAAVMLVRLSDGARSAKAAAKSSARTGADDSAKTGSDEQEPAAEASTGATA